MQINGKTFVVTGAGNGMGREVTLEILRRGGSVIGIDLKKEFLEETKLLATTNSASLRTEVLDITDREAVAALSKKYPDVDGLVNVAGIIQPFVKVERLEMSDVDRVMNVNFFGVMNLIHTFLPILLGRPEAHILNVSSMGSYAPVPGQTVYGASKAALNLLTEGLRSELSETNVKLTLIWPGAIGTNISGNSGVTVSSGTSAEAPKMKVTTAVDAGVMIVDAIEQGKKRAYIGADATFMGRLAKFSTDSAAKLIYKNLKHLLS